MEEYLAGQIETGKLKYSLVIKEHPQFKEKIDEVLINDGVYDLIDKE